jgi:Fe2+ transport system protein FeoA
VTRPNSATSCLADLAVGERGRVLNVLGCDEISLRLLEMGLTPGVDVELLGTAPLGDPLEFDVRGYHLSVRKSEAQRVEIQSL